MVLRPQDLLVVLKLAAAADRVVPTAVLAREVGMSASEAHQALKRAVRAQLLAESATREATASRGRPVKRLLVNRRALVELVTHGIRYVFVAERGKLTRGMPTAHAASPLRELVAEAGPPPVWPDAKGTVRGESFTPLYPSVSTAARTDAKLYQLLALLDAIRGGSARTRELAQALFERTILGG
jgi:hypothetical protein